MDCLQRTTENLCHSSNSHVNTLPFNNHVLQCVAKALVFTVHLIAKYWEEISGCALMISSGMFWLQWPTYECYSVISELMNRPS